MSKDFDSTLSDAIDLAAAAAHTTGASAARLRGRKRAMRKRIAISAMSLVLIATGATVAFKYAGSSNGGAPQVTSTGPHTTSSPDSTWSPSPALASSPSPANASGGPSATASTPGTSPATIVADPHQLVPGAWLSPSQIPFDLDFHWKAVPSSGPGQVLLGQPLSPTVAYVPMNFTFQGLTVCGDPAKLMERTIGAQHAGDDPSTGRGTEGGQFIFFFADASSAQQAFAFIQSEYSLHCFPGSGGVSSIKTAGDGVTGAAWITSEHPSAGDVPVDLSPYNREYFVLRGSTIAWVSIFSTSSALGAAHDDAVELSAIARHLCVYGGPCE